MKLQNSQKTENRLKVWPEKVYHEKYRYYNYNYSDMVKHELRVESLKAGVESLKARVQIHELRPQIHELQVKIHNLLV